MEEQELVVYLLLIVITYWRQSTIKVIWLWEEAMGYLNLRFKAIVIK